MEKIKLNEAKEMVKTSISSLFTKQDVIELLERLDTGTNMNNITDLFRKIKMEFSNDLESVIDQIVDKDDIRLELCGNEILIEDVEINTNVIERTLSDILDNLEEDFEEQK